MTTYKRWHWRWCVNSKPAQTKPIWMIGSLFETPFNSLNSWVQSNRLSLGQNGPPIELGQNWIRTSKKSDLGPDQNKKYKFSDHFGPRGRGPWIPGYSLIHVVCNRSRQPDCNWRKFKWWPFLLNIWTINSIYETNTCSEET